MKFTILFTLLLLITVINGRPQEYLFHAPIVESNRGVDANGMIEYGNQGWGNNIAAGFLLCFTCSKG